MTGTRAQCPESCRSQVAGKKDRAKKGKAAPSRVLLKPRNGHIIKGYLSTRETATIAEIRRYLNILISDANEGREARHKLRKPTYASWYQYFKHFVRLGLVERIGERTMESQERPAHPERMGFGEQMPDGRWRVRVGAAQRIWRLTPRGQAETEAWNDPVRAVGSRS